MTTHTAERDRSDVIDTAAAPLDEGRRGGVIVPLVFAFLMAGIAVLAYNRLADPATPLEYMAELDQSALVADTGVEIDHVALLGSGGLIEVRYRIVNVERSEIVHSVQDPPRVLHDGLEYRVQRHEHSHVRENVVGSSYNEHVMNLGSAVKRGDYVTVLIGQTALERVIVQ